MNTLFMRTTALFLLGLVACGSGRTDITGNWQGRIDGKPALLSLKRDGGSITGTIVMGSYRYTLKGKRDRNAVTGRLYDTSGKHLDFIMAAGRQTLTMTLIYRHPATGKILRRAALLFGRPGVATANTMPRPATGAPAAPPSSTTQGRAPAQRDTRLVGRWVYTRYHTSGDYTSRETTYLVMHPDGTYQYGGGRHTASTPSVYARSSRRPVQTGRWKTRNRIIYVLESGSSEWEAHARYYVDGKTLLMTFEDGSRMLWKRY